MQHILKAASKSMPKPLWSYSAHSLHIPTTHAGSMLYASMAITSRR